VNHANHITKNNVCNNVDKSERKNITNDDKAKDESFNEDNDFKNHSDKLAKQFDEFKNQSNKVRILEQKYIPPYQSASDSDVEMATVLITFPQH